MNASGIFNLEERKYISFSQSILENLLVLTLVAFSLFSYQFIVFTLFVSSINENRRLGME